MTAETIQVAWRKCFSMPPDVTIDGRMKCRQMAESRMAAMTLAAQLNPHLRPATIAAWFGRTRGMIDHAIRRCAELREIDDDFNKKMKAMEQILTEDMGEVGKYRDHVQKYCQGNGIDIGSGGTPINPRAIQIEMSFKKSMWYRSNTPFPHPIQWHDDQAALNLPFKDQTLDYVSSSHLLEDFLDWWQPLREWVRVLKVGGYLIIGVPDKKRWAVAVSRGQPPNLLHRHEAQVGELSTYADKLGLKVLEDRLTDNPPGDYNILFVGQKK